MVIAAFAPWHEHHREARRALGRRAVVVSHAAFEAYSSLTRMPPPERARAADVVAFLDDWFADRWLGLTSGAQRLALQRLDALGVSGGPTYDGLIALTAAASDATLVTLDRRALHTYALVGADVELVA